VHRIHWQQHHLLQIVKEKKQFLVFLFPSSLFLVFSLFLFFKTCNTSLWIEGTTSLVFG
jgi:hypothetical protein